MRPAVSTYVREISGQLSYLANWPVVVPLRLGTIGTLDNSLFEPVGDVANFGIGGAVVPGEAQADISYSSDRTKAGAIDFGAAIPSVPAAGGAGGNLKVTFSFSRDYSVALRMTGVIARRIQDQISLATRIADLAGRGVWDPRWYIVTDVLTADSVTVLVSGKGQSAAEFSLDFTQPVPSGLDLLQASLHPTLTSQASMDTVILNANGATPLFKAKRIKKSFWQGIVPELEAGAAALVPVDESVGPDELFDDFSSYDQLD
jgi:hypothetical protein